MIPQIISNVKNSVLSLTFNMPPQELEAKKQEIVTLLDELAPVGDANTAPAHAKLSAREREVFDMILAGKRLKEIAAILDISVKTVTTHRSRLMKKLNVEDNLSLYRYGIRSGLIGV
jgi:two-component system invasion response regulator UvrY